MEEEVVANSIGSEDNSEKRTEDDDEFDQDYMDPAPYKDESIAAESGKALPPFVGQQFNTHEEAHKYYDRYARSRGFGTRKYSTRKSKRDEVTYCRNYVCRKQGKKRVNDKAMFQKQDLRTDCKANMWIAKTNDEFWKVTVFNDEHNHPMSTPGSVIHRSSRKSLHQHDDIKGLMDSLHKGGFDPSTIARVLNVCTSSSNKEETTTQQCIQHLKRGRISNIGKESSSIIKHFQEKGKTDPLFYFTVQGDEDQMFRVYFGLTEEPELRTLSLGMFWCLMSCIADRFSMPFVSFTGVNHHRQSTLFGCALLADETLDTFIWLFKEWMQCMRNKDPGTIVTDQDPAICCAIKQLFPTSRHRYCSWHIERHLTDKIQLLQDPDSNFQTDYDHWFNCESVVESEKQWVKLKEKYQLESNIWLMKLYEKRHHWVPAYWKDTFTAGMRSSQRSESINKYFDGYVHAMTPLTEFVEQYEKPVDNHCRAEKKEDILTLVTVPKCEKQLAIEREAAQCYTNRMFKIFHEEFKASWSYWKQKVQKEGLKTVYIVGLESKPTSSWRTVIFDKSSQDIEISCSCAKFETEGMLCGHALCILRLKMVAMIPSQYILRRWTIEARHKLDSPHSSQTATTGNGMTEVSPLMMFNIRSKANRMIDEVQRYVELYNEFDEWMTEKLAKRTMGTENVEKDVVCNNERSGEMVAAPN